MPTFAYKTTLDDAQASWLLAATPDLMRLIFVEEDDNYPVFKRPGIRVVAPDPDEIEQIGWVPLTDQT